MSKTLVTETEYITDNEQERERGVGDRQKVWESKSEQQRALTEHSLENKKKTKTGRDRDRWSGRKRHTKRDRKTKRERQNEEGDKWTKRERNQKAEKG